MNQNDSAEDERAVKPKFLIVFAVCAVFGVGYGVWSLLDGPPSVDALTREALSAANAQDRNRAALQLTLRPGRETAAQLRRLAAESRDADIVAMAINSLSDNHSMDNLPYFYKAMDHAERPVREAALRAALKVHGDLPSDLKFEIDDPPATRAKVTSRLLELHEGQMRSLPPETLLAAKSTPAPAPADTPSPAPNAAPTPASIPTPAPTPSAAVPSAPSPYGAVPLAMPREGLGIVLLTWTCRSLAALLFVVEAVATLSLVLEMRYLAADKKQQNQSKIAKVDNKPQPTATEDLARMVLAREQLGPWTTRIYPLIGGALAIAALLSCAEMFRMAAETHQVRLAAEIQQLSRGR